MKKISAFQGLLLLLLFAAGAAAQPNGQQNPDTNLARGMVGRRAGHHALSSAPQTATAGPAAASSSPSYTFGYLDFPQAENTEAISFNRGAATSRMDIVGQYGNLLLDSATSGFVLDVSESAGTTYEAYTPVNLPGYSLQMAEGINDFGQIVGNYFASNNTFQSYLLSGGKFTPIQVPFAGATQTFASGINNAGEIVGVWTSNTVTQGFELKGGVYTSLIDPLGAQATEPFAINNKGDILGTYVDSAGIYHGFLLSGGTYSSIDFPGAVGTLANGINDGGDVVGYYCTTTNCVNENNNAQGFLLRGGVFTTVNVPGACWSKPEDINNKGVIVGNFSDCGTDSGEDGSFLAYP